MSLIVTLQLASIYGQSYKAQKDLAASLGFKFQKTNKRVFLTLDVSNSPPADSFHLPHRSAHFKIWPK
jgi:hypothetical protein